MTIGMIILIVVAILILLGVGQRVLDRMRLNDKLALLFIALIIGLGFVPDFVKPEQTFGQSRFDLYYEAGGRRGFVEVKGVTLEEGGVAWFPDAPTERGCKHLRELQAAAAQGYEAWVLFVIQMPDIRWFEPNDPRDPAFGEALRQAARNGVQVRAVSCQVTPFTMEIDVPVEVRL